MSTHVAHHFDDMEQQHLAATVGMWAFLATEIMFFGGMFAGYMIYRMRYPAGFEEGSLHLDLVLGTINTFILLTSSLTVALSVHAAHTNRQKRLVRLLVATIVLGLAFLGIKAYEYSHKFHEGLVPGPGFELQHPYNPAVNPMHAEMFFSLYFAMTGFHALHMVIGIGVFAAITAKAARRRFSAEYYTPVEISGIYWHFVDLIWVYLYPLLYLIGGA